MQTFQELLTSALAANELTVATSVEQQLVAFLTLLEMWNKTFNLTAITNPREMVYLHIIDSLKAAPAIHGNRILDVGSGAGLPAIPLAICHPEQHWTALDKNSKKTRFITQSIAELRLTNVQAAYSRVEDFKPESGFDSIISRAYGTINLFIESTQHLLNSGGIFIAMKGKYPQEELDHLPGGFQVKNVIPTQINGLDVERHLITIERTSK